MSRTARAVASGFPHLILQKGRNHHVVFKNDDDYRRYLAWLNEYAKKYDLRILAYCLTSQEIQYVAIPTRDNSLSHALNFLHLKYALYVKRKNRRQRHLWQGRFFSCVLDEAHAHAAIRHVESGPVKAGLVKRPEDHPWSSARSHVQKDENPILYHHLSLIKEIKDWAAYLAEPEDKRLIKNIHASLKTGRPCGDADFIGRIEDLLHRPFRGLPRGRPKKQTSPFYQPLKRSLSMRSGHE